MDNFFSGFLSGVVFITFLDLLVIPASCLSGFLENLYLSRFSPHSFVYRLFFHWRGFLR